MNQIIVEILIVQKQKYLILLLKNFYFLSSKDYHKIEIELIGPKGSNDCSLKVNTTRLSPSSGSHVSSSATFGSFLSSLLSKKFK
jgi:hypothetical protein